MPVYNMQDLVLYEKILTILRNKEEEETYPAPIWAISPTRSSKVWYGSYSMIFKQRQRKNRFNKWKKEEYYYYYYQNHSSDKIGQFPDQMVGRKIYCFPTETFVQELLPFCNTNCYLRTISQKKKKTQMTNYN